ncbi:hypothetical protein B0H19DRAFT_1375576 [Mycena capillaripes]|nr:hypothetical protein B0H19DRAFT_1375576 [Mycena capillaripes]
MLFLPLLIALVFATLVVPPVLMYVDPDGLSIEYARQALLIPGVVIKSIAARAAAAVSPVLALGSFVLDATRLFLAIPLLFLCVFLVPFPILVPSAILIRGTIHYGSRLRHLAGTESSPVEWLAIKLREIVRSQSPITAFVVLPILVIAVFTLPPAISFQFVLFLIPILCLSDAAASFSGDALHLIQSLPTRPIWLLALGGVLVAGALVLYLWCARGPAGVEDIPFDEDHAALPDEHQAAVAPQVRPPAVPRPASPPPPRAVQPPHGPEAVGDIGPQAREVDRVPVQEVEPAEDLEPAVRPGPQVPEVDRALVHEVEAAEDLEPAARPGPQVPEVHRVPVRDQELFNVAVIAADPVEQLPSPLRGVDSDVGTQAQGPDSVVVASTFGTHFLDPALPQPSFTGSTSSPGWLLISRARARSFVLPTPIMTPPSPGPHSEPSGDTLDKGKGKAMAVEKSLPQVEAETDRDVPSSSPPQIFSPFEMKEGRRASMARDAVRRLQSRSMSSIGGAQVGLTAAEQADFQSRAPLRARKGRTGRTRTRRVGARVSALGSYTPSSRQISEDSTSCRWKFLFVVTLYYFPFPFS